MPAATSHRTEPISLVVVGHAALSHHFMVDTFPTAPTKTPAHAHHALVGGMGANAAIAAARLGAQVRFITRLGDDTLADEVIARLQGEGVDTSCLLRRPGMQTSTSSVIVDARGERWVFNHRGNAILQEPPPLDVSQLQGADAVLVDPRWFAGSLAALRWARQQRVLGVLDADICPPADLRALVASSDWAAFSLGGLRCLVPDLIPNGTLGSPSALLLGLQLACGLGAQRALVTMGEWGVRTLSDDRSHLQATRSLKVRAVDTTGAGDVFHAALAVALAEGETAEDAQKFACMAAALKCAGGVGVQGAPLRRDVEGRLADNHGEFLGTAFGQSSSLS